MLTTFGNVALICGNVVGSIIAKQAFFEVGNDALTAGDFR